MTFISYILVGLAAGTTGGALGLGGGIVMVPALVFFFGLTQHQAQGTTLAVMLPPILFFAVLRYWQAGNVKIQMACMIAIGFCIGAYLGGSIAHQIPGTTLKKVFGIVMIIVGIKMVFTK